jgi:hypothetical protein
MGLENLIIIVERGLTKDNYDNDKDELARIRAGKIRSKKGQFTTKDEDALRRAANSRFEPKEE